MEKEFLTENKIDKDKLREQALSSLRASHKKIIDRIDDPDLKWAIDNDLRKQIKIKAKSGVSFGREMYGSKDKFERHIKIEAFKYSQARQVPPEQNYIDALDKSADQAVGVTEVYEEIASRIEKLTTLNEEERKTMAYFTVRQDAEEELRKLVSLDTEKEIYIRAEKAWKTRVKETAESHPVQAASQKEALAADSEDDEVNEWKRRLAELGKELEGKTLSNLPPHVPPPVIEQPIIRPTIIEPPAAVINPDEIANARVAMGRAEQDYIAARSVSRSFWKNLGGVLKSLGSRTRRGQRVATPDERMEAARGRYEAARNRFIALQAEASTAGLLVDEETRRVQVAKEAARLLYEEANGIQGQRGFLQKELNFNEQRVPKYRFWSRYYRKPWVRAGLGLGVALGLGLAIPTGQWWVIAPLVATRVASGTIGFEGLFHKMTDAVATKWGSRRRDLIVKADQLDRINKFEEMRNVPDGVITENLASWHEEKILKHYEIMPEQPLWNNYRYRLEERLRESLAANSLEDALNVDALYAEKDRALIGDRNARAIRWLSALALSSALSMFFLNGRIGKVELPKVDLPRFQFPWSGTETPPSAVIPDKPDIWIPEPITPEPSTPIPSLVPGEPGSEGLFTDYTYNDPDFFYRDIAMIDSIPIGIGDISSVEGRVQYLLGRDYYGIFQSPDDVYAQTPEAYGRLQEFWQRFGSDNLAQERVQVGIEHYRAINPPNAFDVTFEDQEGDVIATNRNLLWHKDGADQLIKYWERSNWKDFFDNLGRGYSRN